MADSTDNTNLMLADGNNDLVANDDTDGVVGEQKSGLAGAMGNVDFLRQITIVMALAICLAIAIFVIMWANQAEYRLDRKSVV